MSISARPWQVQDELIEQPSWGGRYIIDLKGLSNDPAWAGKKVGQSYELARSSKLINPDDSTVHRISDLIDQSAPELLGQRVIEKFGTDLSLLIKLTQAKGNSFQVHLPKDKDLKHWRPKPEAWFYLAPGLYTFGLKHGVTYEEFSTALTAIDDEMQRLSAQVKSGAITVDDARSSAKQYIDSKDPYKYINVVEAKTDDIVNLTSGGIHHSWEDDSERFPQGNLVYEVQVDVQDEYCSMRGFDKGKFLDDGSLRPTHVADYLSTIEQDSYHNDLSHHILRPQVINQTDIIKIEALFRTSYFNLDRLTLEPSAALRQSATSGFHHLFIFEGDIRIGEDKLIKGQSYIIPAVVGEYDLVAGINGCTALKTYLP